MSFRPDIGPLVHLGISIPAAIRGAQSPKFHAIQALVDTGAAVTCISTQVASAVGVRPAGKMPLVSATQSIPVNTYVVDVALYLGDPTSHTTLAAVSENQQVMEFNASSGNYQALLGRDILCKGLLSVAGWNGTFSICM